MRGALSAAPDQTDETTSKAIEDARRFGMDEASLVHLGAALNAASGAVVDAAGQGVWPEHVAVVEAFLAVTTQFRVVPIGGGFAPARLLTMGFDYAGVRAGLDAEGIAVTLELWRDLRVMEYAATAALNEGNR